MQVLGGILYNNTERFRYNTGEAAAHYLFTAMEGDEHRQRRIFTYGNTSGDNTGSAAHIHCTAIQMKKVEPPEAV